MKKLLFAALLALPLWSGCSSTTTPAATTTTPTLYKRLGETAAITAVVDKFITYVAADNRINSFFAATVASQAKASRLRQNLIDQICQASGGPCTYKGLSMAEAHKGMNIKVSEFNALVEDLVKALDDLKVPAKEKSELLSILAPMQSDIVGK